MMVHEYIPDYAYDLTKNTEVNYKDGHKFLPSLTWPCDLLWPKGQQQMWYKQIQKMLCIGASILLHFLEPYNSREEAQENLLND